MITFLEGTVVSVSEKRLVLNVGHVGFQVGITTRDSVNMPPEGEEVRVFTYMSVREDAISLFGFLDEEDLDIYRMLIGVNGIGPKAGLAILSAMSAQELKMAVVTDDEKRIAKAPGIGAKTAKKLILELKDKIKAEDILTAGAQPDAAEKQNPQFDANRQEAIEVLTALGLSRSEAVRLVRAAAVTEDMDADQILTAALQERN